MNGSNAPKLVSDQALAAIIASKPQPPSAFASLCAVVTSGIKVNWLIIIVVVCIVFYVVVRNWLKADAASRPPDVMNDSTSESVTSWTIPEMQTHDRPDIGRDDISNMYVDKRTFDENMTPLEFNAISDILVPMR